MSRRLFGTDGVRGPVGSVLTDDLAWALGRAAITHVGGAGSRLLVIRDTRESGPMLELALAEGAATAGAVVHLGGVLPTPAAPLLIRAGDYDLAAVISASHNPYQDNGIKLFGTGGYKLSDADEAAIEALVPPAADVGANTAPGTVAARAGLGDRYIAALRERFSGLDLSGKRIALDCANGATYEVAPAIFAALGAETTNVAVSPDGRNINAACGSTHPESLVELVRGGGFDAGFAFDGDGVRLLAVGPDGTVVDGDELLAVMALALQQRGTLTGNGIAVTVMSNYGLHGAMEAAGITVAVTAVGDRHVLAELRDRGWRLGGEQSGHIIDMSFVPSGDGIASALLVLESLGGQPLGAQACMERLPQVLVNVPVVDRDAVLADAVVASAVERAQERLAGRGRVLVRPSGTEQLLRVMAEAPTGQEADAVCDELAQLIRAHHGA